MCHVFFQCLNGNKGNYQLFINENNSWLTFPDSFQFKQLSYFFHSHFLNEQNVEKIVFKVFYILYLFPHSSFLIGVSFDLKDICNITINIENVIRWYDYFIMGGLCPGGFCPVPFLKIFFLIFTRVLCRERIYVGRNQPLHYCHSFLTCWKSR